MNAVEGDNRENRDNSYLLQVQTQLGEIKGILQTIVVEHARRLEGLDGTVKQLRVDLTAIKSESDTKLEALGERIQTKWDAAVKDGNIAYLAIKESLAEHRAGISENHQDIRDLTDKMHNHWSRVALIVSPIIALAALVYNMVVVK